MLILKREFNIITKATKTIKQSNGIENGQGGQGREVKRGSFSSGCQEGLPEKVMLELMTVYQPSKNLGKKRPGNRAQQVQRSCGRNGLVMSEKQKGQLG